MNEENWLTRESVLSVDFLGDLTMDDPQFKDITTTTINHFLSDGSAKDAITNGTSETNQCQRGKEVRRKRQSWILSTAASHNHARILVLQELESAWEASEVDFFTTSPGLSQKQTRDSYFSKTSQQLELVASTVSLKHLPSSGMIVGGRLYQPQKLAPRTLEKDGSYLPTPMARDWKGTTGKKRYTQNLPNLLEKNGGKLSPMWVEWLMGYPLGWTELKDWATLWFRSKRGQRSKD